ncbi:MAG: hypothetical protein Q8S35_02100 [bacterium]|nr:hypothetical protein [bacterium]
MEKLLKMVPLGALSFLFVGSTAAAQSEITGTLTGSGETTDTTDSGDGTLGGTVTDDSDGTLGGTVSGGGSSGTLGGTVSDGSTLGGTVSGGSSGGGGGSSGGGGGGSSNNNQGEVLGASDDNTGGSVLGDSTGFPNTGLGGEGLTLMFALIAAAVIASIGIYLASRRAVR